MSCGICSIKELATPGFPRVNSSKEKNMKGTVVKCMEELVTKKFGVEKWKQSLKNAGLAEGRQFTTGEDVAEPEILAIMTGIGTAAGITNEQVYEAFGEYWSSVYAPEIYDVYFAKAKNTKEMLLNLDKIHVQMTRTIPSAHPPRFTYDWKGEDTLIMNYDSNRGLIALMPGLIRGLGKYYKDNPKVTLSANAIQIQFA
jgi:hypothetical protein